MRRERIAWRADSTTDPELTLLPRMETDISLRRGASHVIIDAKYYHSSLSSYYATDKLHGANLYQLLSYLSNSEPGDGENLSGMLIYPRVDRTLREQYVVQGYRVSVFTVDLNRDWKDIRSELLSLVG